MGKQGQCGVYKLNKLGREGDNGFTREFKKLERDLHVINHDYADLINKNSLINGLEYEYCEDADKLYWDKKPFKGVVEVVEDIDALREEYKELSKLDPKLNWGVKRLSEEIEKLKN